MVVSEKIYTPQRFVEIITGHCYIFSGDSVTHNIQKKLRYNGYELWDYPMSEIEHIVENCLNVVLVDVSSFGDKGYIVPEYRWFEVPADFIEKEKILECI